MRQACSAIHDESAFDAVRRFAGAWKFWGAPEEWTWDERAATSF
jgi:hypothetical protein